MNVQVPSQDTNTRGRKVKSEVDRENGFDLFTLFVYFAQLSPSGGAFLAEMAGQLNWLNGRATNWVKWPGAKLA